MVFGLLLWKSKWLLITEVTERGLPGTGQVVSFYFSYAFQLVPPFIFLCFILVSLQSSVFSFCGCYAEKTPGQESLSSKSSCMFQSEYEGPRQSPFWHGDQMLWVQARALGSGCDLSPAAWLCDQTPWVQARALGSGCDLSPAAWLCGDGTTEADEMQSKWRENGREINWS